MDLEVKFDPLVFKVHINVHNLNHESDPIDSIISPKDTLQPLPIIYHDSLFLDLLNQTYFIS